MTRQLLIFDADDTLWENNLLFERVIDDFLEWLAHPTLDRAQIRAIFDDIEAANTVAHGYGSRVFLRSLSECFAHLQERPATDEERQQIDSLAVALVDHQVELIPGVSETLHDVAGRHDLWLLTKGDATEQQRKIDASELAHHFAEVIIVAEKNVETYARVLRTHGLDPATTWMIGNSPKSDILPARQVGMSAVFIPNDNTWALEHAELDPNDTGVLRLRAFPEIREHF